MRVQTGTGAEDAAGGPAYTFGDSDGAVTRLRLLSELFNPSTATFLRAAVPTPPKLAVDLGCGPGYTTHMLATALGAERTVGLDNSAHFLEVASATATDRVSFAPHDVTTTPFPVDGLPDVAYARWLLMHLPAPDAVLRRWGGAMAPGGLVVAHESETIRAAHPAFETYLEIVAAMLAANDNAIYLGPHLDTLADTGPLRRRDSHVWQVDVPADVVARLYTLNVQSWQAQSWVRDNVPEARIAGLLDDLAALRGTSGQPGIEWDVRAVVFERTG